VALESRLADFVRRFPNDPGTDRARVLLTWLLIDRGDLAQADEALTPALSGPESTTRDHARLLRAAWLTRRGQPAEALRLLEPLDGKLIGQDVTRLYWRERARAALEARRWRLLVESLRAWLDTGAHGQERLREHAAQSLAQIPSHALVRLLEEQTQKRAGPASGTQAWMERAMTDRLARAALEAADARLARQLLEVAPSWLRATPQGAQLTELARVGAGEARVAGRTLGVVVEEEDPDARRRSSQVVAGVVEALGMGRGERDLPVRLVVRENRGDMGATLAALAGEGASVLIGGVDERGARVALTFAEERRVPVMVLTDPAERARELAYGFVLGASASREKALLDAALVARGLERLELVGEAGFSCRSRPSHPGATRFPVASWQRDGVQGVVLLGDAQCARQLLNDARSAGKALPLGLGLEASQILFEVGAGQRLGLSAGVYPGGAEPATVGWYELLGRDAARLARAALAVVPEDTEVDGEAVRAHLERARNALAEARAELETTGAQGFAGQRVLRREIRVVEAPQAPGGARREE
jgi:hypothetical protein